MKNKYILRLVLALFLILSSYTSKSQNADTLRKLINDSLTIIKKRVEQKICNGRYMEGRILLETDSLQGWEGYKVTLFEYLWPQKNGVIPKYKTQVYLADANSDQLAKWIISACYLATEGLKKGNTDLLIEKINYQSNGQFPVSGFVFENMADSFETSSIIFKDGVTVHLKNTVKQTLGYAIDTILIKSKKVYLKTSLATDLLKIKDSNITTTGNYARIIGTPKYDYIKNGGKENSEGLNWLKIVREEYQKAFNTDTNFLMLAWAKQHLKK